MENNICDGSCLYGACPHKTCIKSAMKAHAARRVDTGMEIMMDAGDVAATGSGLGVAIDIGTTTVVACLYDMATGKLLLREGKINSQTQYGLDVISRIKYASDFPSGTADMCAAVTADINELLGKLTATPDDIQKVVITGNTTMLHLAAELSPEPMGHLPFTPQSLFGVYRTGADMRLCCKHARVYLADCVSAFVGGDTVTAMLAVNFFDGAGTSLILDIGTNGEIALRTAAGVFATSTAAGPAFEGSEIERGMAAVEGAVSHIDFINGKIITQVIGGGQPRGLCGSGILDAVAFMLKTGLIDETGRIDGECGLSSMIENGNVVFAPGVYITQRDVRMIQNAKAAIAAGVEALMNRMGVDGGGVDRVYLAGGFGNYMDAGSASDIGLIPGKLGGKVVPVGNAAVMGAAMALCDEAALEKLSVMAAETQHLDLSQDPFFMDRYVEDMMF